jgi:hypothetical protein
MTAPAPSVPTLAEQIEACEYALTFLVGPAKAAAMMAATKTLRRVQACRSLAEKQIDDGIIVAADIEGLIA